MDAASLVSVIDQVAERIFGPDIARPVMEPLYRRAFLAARGWRNLALGAFSTYEEALRYCRTLGVNGQYSLDHRWWTGVQASVKSHDYPVL